MNIGMVMMMCKTVFDCSESCSNKFPKAVMGALSMTAFLCLTVKK